MQLHVVVRGRVQGVGFRWFVRETARKLELAGWVMNRADGGVEVAADGESSRIQSLCAALRAGPRGSVVADLEELPPYPDDLPSPFAITR